LPQTIRKPTNILPKTDLLSIEEIEAGLNRKIEVKQVVQEAIE